MGTGFENIAHVLSRGYKKSLARGFRLKISSVQSARISAITVGLASGAIRPNRIEEDKLIMSDVKAGEPVSALRRRASMLDRAKERSGSVGAKGLYRLG